MAYYSCDFNIGFNAFRLDNTGGHISHLAGAFFWFLFHYCKRVDRDVTGYYYFFI
jgi:hypothetical protein